jgi:hypothetical protein
MKRYLIDRIPFSKIATILSIAAALCTGLCGVAALVASNHGNPGSIGKLEDGLFLVGGVGFWGSMLGLILLAMAYVVLWIAKDLASRRSGSD